MTNNKITNWELHTHDRTGSDITLHSLNQIDSQTLVRLSELTLPEVEHLKHEIATVLPAGNLPGLLLAGLTSVKGRELPRKRIDQDIKALFQGATLLPQGVYSLLFAGPAAVLSAYQSILKLSGKDVDSAFPEGTWQFYLQFGLREDTGRHTNETIGYHRERPPAATVVDDITAWIMAAIYMLFDSESLAGTLWLEWTTLRLLHEASQEAGLSGSARFNSLLRDWQKARPYRCPAGVSYADQRRLAFDDFSKAYYERLPDKALLEISQKIQTLSEAEQAAYQRQLSLLAYLQPGRFRDERIPIPLWEAKIGLIWRGHIFLIDACVRDEQGRPLAFEESGQNWPLDFDDAGHPLDRKGKPLITQGGWLYRAGRDKRLEPVAYIAPPEPALVKGQVERIVNGNRTPSSSTIDLRLTEEPRGRQAELRKLLPAVTSEALRRLTSALILINWDEQDRSLPLSTLRHQTRRGVGDHPLTIMRTTDTVVFDHSHIFFDGVWGMAIAEVMTNQAVSWCQYVVNTDPQPSTEPQPLRLTGSPEFEMALARRDGEVDIGNIEVDAESTAVDMAVVEDAREWLRQRGAGLTINDLLLLARIIHAADYQPDPALAITVADLSADLRDQVHESLKTSGRLNPAILIPMDASFVSPRERIFPTTFRNTLDGLLDAYAEAVAALVSYHADPGDATWSVLDVRRRELFVYLRTFGEILDAIKAITMRGESLNTATIRLLAHLPPSMQHLLDQIPQRVEVLNEIIKGEEVFSNVGRVATGSSLVRFMSAKDDGRSKVLVWGILTDDAGRMHISLRDFRPHVAPLLRTGNRNLAVRLAQDYVDSYAATLTALARHLMDMALAADEMRWN